MMPMLGRSAGLALIAATWVACASAQGEADQAGVPRFEERFKGTYTTLNAQLGAPSASERPPDPSLDRSQTALGDLSSFRAIALDTLRIAQAGDLRAARRRIDDLESSWNQATPKMKSLSPDKWKTLDAAIDRAERELRFWRVKRTDSTEALQELIRTIDAVN